VDLNIKLMRWRQLETLDLHKLHEVKVLLLAQAHWAARWRGIVDSKFVEISLAGASVTSPS
jgi:hypothetical protein